MSSCPYWFWKLQEQSDFLKWYCFNTDYRNFSPVFIGVFIYSIVFYVSRFFRIKIIPRRGISLFGGSGKGKGPGLFAGNLWIYEIGIFQGGGGAQRPWRSSHDPNPHPTWQIKQLKYAKHLCSLKQLDHTNMCRYARKWGHAINKLIEKDSKSFLKDQQVGWCMIID